MSSMSRRTRYADLYNKKGSSGRVKSQYAIHRQLAFELSIEKRKIGFALFGFSGVFAREK